MMESEPVVKEKKPLPKPTKPIAKKSDKRKEVDKEYRKIVKEFLKKNPNCEIKAPGCDKIATGLHHLVKRSPNNLTDRKNLKRACNSCQLWIEENPVESMKLGHSKSKFKKQ